jgi:hypothetical protein
MAVWDLNSNLDLFSMQALVSIVEGGANIFEVFRVKNHDFTPKNHFFFNFRGGGGARRVCPPPPEYAPELCILKLPSAWTFRSKLVKNKIIQFIVLLQGFVCLVDLISSYHLVLSLYKYIPNPQKW